MDGNFRNAAIAALALVSLGLSACSGGTLGSPAQPNAGSSSGLGSQGVRRAYTPACPCEYVADIKGNTTFPGTVIIFPITANGNYNPGANVIVGSNTGLVNPAGIALDSASNIYVTNQSNASVTVYPAGSSGNVAPMATISGASTGLLNPFGIALDSANRIYVANGLGTTTPSVTVYAAGSNGNVAPMATIAGSLTGLADPSGIVVDPTGRIYVGNENSPSLNGIVTVYAVGANGNVAPIRTVAGSNTGFANGVYGVAWANNRIYVTSGNTPFNSQIGIFPQNANGNVAPTRSISGASTQLASPVGIAIGPTNNRIYVANVRGPSVATFTAYSSLVGGNNNIAPARLISGGNTQLGAPYGVVVR